MQCDSSPQKKGKFGGRDRGTQEAHHVNMKAEIRVMHLQASNAIASTPQRLGERQGTVSLTEPTLIEGHSAKALFLDSGPQSCNRIKFLFKPSSLWCFVSAALAD